MLVSPCLTLCKPMDCSLSGFSVHGIFKARILEWVALSWSRSLFPSPNPGFELTSPTLQADSLPAEPPQKPKNTGVGSPSLLQRIFLTQGSNPGLPPCRQILYQLSYQESPDKQHIPKIIVYLKFK